MSPLQLTALFWLCVHNGGDLASKSPNKTERLSILSARLCAGIIGQVMPQRLSKEFGCAGIGDSGNVLVFSKAPPGSDCSTNTPPVTHIPGDGKTHTSIGPCSAIIFAKAFHSCTNSRCSHKPTVPSALTLAHNMPIEPHTDILTHTHTGAPLWHFCYYFLTCVFTSTFTVIRAHIASAVLSRAKWFVMICLDRGIVFPLRMGSLDGAFSSGCVHTAGGASVFAATLSVYKESTYCMPPLCVGCAPRTGQHVAWHYKYHAGPDALGCFLHSEEVIMSFVSTWA